MKMDKISKGDPIVKSKEDQWRNLVGQLNKSYTQTFIDSSR